MANSVSSRLAGYLQGGVLVASCLLLAACTSSGGPLNDAKNSGVRPGIDGAPSGEFDAAAVPDAIPRAHKGAVKASPYTVLGKKYFPLASSAGYSETGTASWYGTKFHGHKTANGEVYDMYGMSAAHKTLPLPSYVRVTNIANGNRVVVRVNDRGPFHGNRIIDMSYAAARKLDFFGKGIAQVKVEALDPYSEQPVAQKAPVPKESAVVTAAPSNEAAHPKMFLQVAALSNQQSADSLQRQLSQVTTFDVTVVTAIEATGPLHRVRIGPLSTLQEVEDVKQQVDNAALGAPHLVYE